jgi:hypothetical protein
LPAATAPAHEEQPDLRQHVQRRFDVVTAIMLGVLAVVTLWSG